MPLFIFKTDMLLLEEGS